MVIVLSAFNGLEDIVESLYSSFDPDIEIKLKEGKTFGLNDIDKEKLLSIEGVEYYSNVIEEITLVKHDDKWLTTTMKGVEEDFLAMSNLEAYIVEGQELLKENTTSFAILGFGIKGRLDVSADPRYVDHISIHGLLRDKKIRKKNNPFNVEPIPVSGVFAINQEFDEQYFLVPFDFASELLEFEKEATAVELGVKEGYDLNSIKAKVENAIGPRFKATTYFEQNALLYQTHQSEKWMTFLILAFILVLSSFTLIASLTMLVIDKKKDIKTLFSMGADSTMIRKIFFLEGVLISVFGALLGLVIGYLICWLQLKFKFVKMEGAVIDYYPIKMELTDLVLILFTLITIGIIATYFPVRYLIKKHFSQEY